MSASRQLCEQYAEPSVCLSHERQKSVHQANSMVVEVIEVRESAVEAVEDRRMEFGVDSRPRDWRCILNMWEPGSEAGGRSGQICSPKVRRDRKVEAVGRQGRCDSNWSNDAGAWASN